MNIMNTAGSLVSTTKSSQNPNFCNNNLAQFFSGKNMKDKISKCPIPARTTIFLFQQGRPFPDMSKTHDDQMKYEKSKFLVSSKDDHSLTATTSSSPPQLLRLHLRLHQDSHRASLNRKTRFFLLKPGSKSSILQPRHLPCGATASSASESCR